MIRVLAFALSLTGFLIPALWLQASPSDLSPLQEDRHFREFQDRRSLEDR